MARLQWNRAEEEKLLRSVNGPVGRDLRLKGERVAREAQRLCPVSPDGSGGNPPGHLRDSIGMTPGRDERGLYVDVGSDVEYALPVETGSRPHEITSHGDWPLRNAKTGAVFGKTVQHPGAEASPFLRPALDVLRND